MNRRPTRGTVAGRIYLDLQNKARREGRSTDELFQLYALEAFLDRLAGSKRAKDFILKGGVLLAAYEERRPTRDVDLLAQPLKNDVAAVLAWINEILLESRDDGLVFGGATAEVIRDEGVYSGIRVNVPCTLEVAKVSFHVDVNVGDPIWPQATIVQLPRLLGGEISVRGYPLSMVYAEKRCPQTVLARGAEACQAKSWAAANRR